MPDINFGIGFTIFFPQGEGGAEYEPITIESYGARVAYGEAVTEYPAITADGEGARVAYGIGGAEYPAVLAFGGNRIHFSTGFVTERKPQTPTVCLDAVSIVEWKADTQWKRVSDKCKPTP